eukprot:9797525-Heterocapsa_arctica.AAC.1
MEFENNEAIHFNEKQQHTKLGAYDLDHDKFENEEFNGPKKTRQHRGTALLYEGQHIKSSKADVIRKEKRK